MALRDRWDVALAVTLGERGVLVIPRDRTVHRLPAHPVTAVDTVGAGDVFCGYFAAGLAAGRDLVMAARTANAAAALSVTRVGSADAAPRYSEVAP
jgi:ribokinase